MGKERSDKKYAINTCGNDQYYLFLCQNIQFYRKMSKNWHFLKIVITFFLRNRRLIYFTGFERGDPKLLI